jgi:hypothetical protein
VGSRAGSRVGPVLLRCHHGHGSRRYRRARDAPRRGRPAGARTLDP